MKLLFLALLLLAAIVRADKDENLSDAQKRVEKVAQKDDKSEKTNAQENLENCYKDIGEEQKSALSGDSDLVDLFADLQVAKARTFTADSDRTRTYKGFNKLDMYYLLVPNFCYQLLKGDTDFPVAKATEGNIDAAQRILKKACDGQKTICTVKKKEIVENLCKDGKNCQPSEINSIHNVFKQCIANDVVQNIIEDRKDSLLQALDSGKLEDEWSKITDIAKGYDTSSTGFLLKDTCIYTGNPVMKKLAELAQAIGTMNVAAPDGDSTNSQGGPPSSDMAAAAGGPKK